MKTAVAFAWKSEHTEITYGTIIEQLPQEIHIRLTIAANNRVSFCL